MTPLEELAGLIKKLPGIGARQARRIAYFFIRTNGEYVNQVMQTIQKARLGAIICSESYQLFFNDSQSTTTSPIVRDATRDFSRLLIVHTSNDVEYLEMLHTYKGQYFVLGELARLTKTTEELKRTTNLIELIKNRKESHNLQEVIFALPVNPDGDYTRDILLQKLKPTLNELGITHSTLGRGLSTGAELEYIDHNTFEAAFEGRR